MIVIKLIESWGFPFSVFLLLESRKKYKNDMHVVLVCSDKLKKNAFD